MKRPTESENKQIQEKKARSDTTNNQRQIYNMESNEEVLNPELNILRKNIIEQYSEIKEINELSKKDRKDTIREKKIKKITSNYKENPKIQNFQKKCLQLFDDSKILGENFYKSDIIVIYEMLNTLYPNEKQNIPIFVFSNKKSAQTQPKAPIKSSTNQTIYNPPLSLSHSSFFNKPVQNLRPNLPPKNNDKPISNIRPPSQNKPPHPEPILLSIKTMVENLDKGINMSNKDFCNWFNITVVKNNIPLTDIIKEMQKSNNVWEKEIADLIDKRNNFPNYSLLQKKDIVSVLESYRSFLPTQNQQTCNPATLSNNILPSNFLPPSSFGLLPDETNAITENIDFLWNPFNEENTMPLTSANLSALTENPENLDFWNYFSENREENVSSQDPVQLIPPPPNDINNNFSNNSTLPFQVKEPTQDKNINEKTSAITENVDFLWNSFSEENTMPLTSANLSALTENPENLDFWNYFSENREENVSSQDPVQLIPPPPNDINNNFSNNSTLPFQVKEPTQDKNIKLPKDYNYSILDLLDYIGKVSSINSTIKLLYYSTAEDCINKKYKYEEIITDQTILICPVITETVDILNSPNIVSLEVLKTRIENLITFVCQLQQLPKKLQIIIHINNNHFTAAEIEFFPHTKNIIFRYLNTLIGYTQKDNAIKETIKNSFMTHLGKIYPEGTYKPTVGNIQKNAHDCGPLVLEWLFYAIPETPKLPVFPIKEEARKRTYYVYFCGANSVDMREMQAKFISEQREPIAALPLTSTTSTTPTPKENSKEDDDGLLFLI